MKWIWFSKVLTQFIYDSIQIQFIYSFYHPYQSPPWNHRPLPSADTTITLVSSPLPKPIINHHKAPAKKTTMNHHKSMALQVSFLAKLSRIQQIHSHHCVLHHQMLKIWLFLAPTQPPTISHTKPKSCALFIVLQLALNLWMKYSKGIMLWKLNENCSPKYFLSQLNKVDQECNIKLSRCDQVQFIADFLLTLNDLE